MNIRRTRLLILSLFSLGFSLTKIAENQLFGISHGIVFASDSSKKMQVGRLNYRVLEDKSVFAVVTHKTGFASALAHNHLVTAGQFRATLNVDLQKLNQGNFAFQTKVSDLEFDRPDLQSQWFPHFKLLGWLSEPYKLIKDSDRKTIREHALAENQLNAEKYFNIEARIINISDSSRKIGEQLFLKKSQVELTILGKKIQREFSANIIEKSENILVDAVAEMRFSDFGIKPYAALMGALGNEDLFHIFVHLEAEKNVH